MVKKQLFLDCDGVLADFDSHFEFKFGMKSDAYETLHGTSKFWQDIKNCGEFFTDLPLMPDAMELYESVKHLRPIILTGTPFGHWSVAQKLAWRNKHFKGVPMVTCTSKHKRDYCQPGDVLIDDLLKYKHLWEEAGGIFIVHTSAQQSIAELNKIW